MKRILTLTMLLTLALALLAASALCEEADPVKEIFDAMVAEGSEYSEGKALYEEFFPGIEYTETLEGDSFTIAVTGSEYMEGSWTFTREGDFLNVTVSSVDYSGMSMANQVLRTAGTLRGVNTTLLSGYIAGLQITGAENPFYRVEEDADSGTMTIGISLGASYEMEGLDQMAITEDVLNEYEYSELTEDYISRSLVMGKVTILMNGNRDSWTLLVAEYGGLDDLAYQAIMATVRASKPAGWEAFAEAYTALENAEGDGYSVTLEPDEEALREITEELFTDYHYAIVRFGA